MRPRWKAGRCPPIVDPAMLRSCFAVAPRQAARTAWSVRERRKVESGKIGSQSSTRVLLALSDRTVIRRGSTRAPVGSPLNAWMHEQKTRSK